MIPTARCILSRKSTRTRLLRKLKLTTIRVNWKEPTKTIFATLNDLLNRNSHPLPDGDDPKVLSEKFSKFSNDKIQKIRSQLDSAEGETETVNGPDELQLYTITTSQFCGFNEVSSEEISKLVGSRPNKTCSLDPIPTWLLKSLIFSSRLIFPS